jgi:hypothetical protein
MRRIVLVIAALSLAACGGAVAPSAPARGGGAAPEPTTVEEAEQQIADAQRELGGERAPAGQAAPPTAEAPADASKKGAEATGDIRESQTAECQSPCRAIASMRRAVVALCRMTGDGDARCNDAKRTLEQSEARVAPCGC